MTDPLRSVRSFAALGAAGAGLLACAPVAPPPGPFAAAASSQCFFSSTVSGFKPAGPGAVNVRSATSGVYRVDLAAPCGDLRAAERILLDSRASGASVCPGADVTMIVSSPAGARACPGRSIRKLSETEVAGLPQAEQP
jgi:hypothetical protein